MKQLVITSFEPFGGGRINASREVARVLQQEGIPGVNLSVVELPVVRGEASERARRVLEGVEPDVLIMLGEAGDRSAVTPERVAVNLDDFPIPDNAGHQPRGEPIVAGGPVGYFSTLPVQAIVHAIAQAGVPAAPSSSAGHFLCNRLFYLIMHAIEGAGLSTRAGFIHVPCLGESGAGKPGAPPGLPLDVLVESIRIAACVSMATGEAGDPVQSAGPGPDETT